MSFEVGGVLMDWVDQDKASSVVIIGAGGSADFGIPLGREVLNKAIDMSRDIAGRFKKDLYPFGQPDSTVGPDQLPHSALTKVLQPLGSIDPIQFAEDIAATSSQTVDNFALENPRYADAARILSTAVLAPNIFEIERKVAQRRRLHRLYTTRSGQAPNWIDLFISVVKEKIRQHGKSNWTIISFNYDAIMENHVRSRWKADPVHGEFDEIFEFLYPYGQFKPEGRFLRARDLVAALAPSIRFAHEIDRYDQVLNLCWSRVFRATEIYILGFACSLQNCEAIGLMTDKYDRSCKVVAQNFDNNRVLNNRLAAVGAESHDIFSGSCSAMIDSGFFGELPT